MRGATQLVMFSDIMDAHRYGGILEAGLVPFIKTCYPGYNRTMILSMHQSILAGSKFHGIHWWKPPPESPDLKKPD